MVKDLFGTLRQTSKEIADEIIASKEFAKFVNNIDDDPFRTVSVKLPESDAELTWVFDSSLNEADLFIEEINCHPGRPFPRSVTDRVNAEMCRRLLASNIPVKY